MKTEFELDAVQFTSQVKPLAKVYLIRCKTSYVKVEFTAPTSTLPFKFAGHIQDKDLERFAVNILKALKSKKLK